MDSRLSDLTVVAAGLLIGVLAYQAIRWVRADPGLPSPRVTDTPDFRNLGVIFTVALWWSIALITRDAYFLRPGEHDTLTSWHGAPWPVVVGLVALGSPIWLLSLLWDRLPLRGPIRRAVVLLGALTVAGYLFLGVVALLRSG